MDLKRKVQLQWINQAKRCLKSREKEYRSHHASIDAFRKSTANALTHSPEVKSRDIVYRLFEHASVDRKSSEARQIILSKNVADAFALAGARSGLNVLIGAVRAYEASVEAQNSEIYKILKNHPGEFYTDEFEARECDAIIIKYLCDLYDEDTDRFEALITVVR